MRSVLISVQPKWCQKIANIIGQKDKTPIYEKSVEIRKTKPKIDVPFKVYIYCTKPKSENDFGLCIDRGMYGTLKSVGLLYKCNYKTAEKMNMTILSGKVIGEFVCDEIKPIHCQSIEKEATYAIAIGNGHKEYYNNSCVSYKEAYRYLRNVKKAYGWHISDLVIYDEPKELSEFFSLCEKGNCHLCDWEREYDSCGCNRKKPIKRPPQSWCYVETDTRQRLSFGELERNAIEMDKESIFVKSAMKNL